MAKAFVRCIFSFDTTISKFSVQRLDEIVTADTQVRLYEVLPLAYFRRNRLYILKPSAYVKFFSPYTVSACLTLASSMMDCSRLDSAWRDSSKTENWVSCPALNYLKEDELWLIKDVRPHASHKIVDVRRHASFKIVKEAMHDRADVERSIKNERLNAGVEDLKLDDYIKSIALQA